MGYVKHKGYIFGPVPSRRLGRSLGVDLVPFKTCTFDCIYCQLGHTTNKTIERREWVPLREVLDELRSKLTLKPDYITLAGSGEPTLYSRIGDLMDEIRLMTDIPVAVITNGSLLWKDEVRRQLRHANVVIPSLDAGDEMLFRTINRPHPDITYERLLDGLSTFRQEFRGKYWLEVFLLDGYTAIDGEVRKIAKKAKEIQADLVQLNTCVRPATEDYARPVPWRRLVELADIFTPAAEVVVDYRSDTSQSESTSGPTDILQMLQRRPCTAEDIAAGLRMDPATVRKEIERLLQEGVIEARKVDPKRTHYVARDLLCAHQRKPAK
jgi:wyosine [tRNA(Phe)-imidazoG37] synthetase (radical SAM superfamily)